MPTNTKERAWTRRDSKYNCKSMTVSYNLPGFPAARVNVVGNSSLKRMEIELLSYPKKEKVTKFFFSPRGKSNYDYANATAEVKYGVLKIKISKNAPEATSIPVSGSRR